MLPRGVGPYMLLHRTKSGSICRGSPEPGSSSVPPLSDLALRDRARGPAGGGWPTAAARTTSWPRRRRVGELAHWPWQHWSAGLRRRCLGQARHGRGADHAASPGWAGQRRYRRWPGRGPMRVPWLRGVPAILCSRDAVAAFGAVLWAGQLAGPAGHGLGLCRSWRWSHPAGCR